MVNGDKVRLLPYNGAPEAIGTVLEIQTNSVILVCIDEEYRQPGDRDGLTEIPHGDGFPVQLEVIDGGS